MTNIINAFDTHVALPLGSFVIESAVATVKAIRSVFSFAGSVACKFLSVKKAEDFANYLAVVIFATAIYFVKLDFSNRFVIAIALALTFRHVYIKYPHLSAFALVSVLFYKFFA